MVSARLDRYAPRDRVWSKLAVPCAIRSKVACRNQIRPGHRRQAAQIKAVTMPVGPWPVNDGAMKPG